MIALAALGVAALAVKAAPGALRLVIRRHSMVLVFLLAALILAWFVAGVLHADQPGPHRTARCHGESARTRSFGHDYDYASSWPWRIGRLPLIWLVLALLCAAGGFVLNADAVRVQLGYAQPRRSNWRLLTSARRAAAGSRSGRFRAWRWWPWPPSSASR